jgi:hypothetical protein
MKLEFRMYRSGLLGVRLFSRGREVNPVASIDTPLSAREIRAEEVLSGSDRGTGA